MSQGSRRDCRADRHETLVGDLCNWFFLIDDQRELSARAQLHVDSINKKLITASHDLLAQIGEIMVVSGTRRKSGALFRLMSSKDLPQISILCTDTDTAMDLVARRKSMP